MYVVDRFTTALKADLFRAAAEVDDCAAATPTPCAFPPPHVLSPEQVKVIAHAVADIREVAHGFYLLKNTAALAARENQGSTRGRPAATRTQAFY